MNSTSRLFILIAFFAVAPALLVAAQNEGVDFNTGPTPETYGVNLRNERLDKAKQRPTNNAVRGLGYTGGSRTEQRDGGVTVDRDAAGDGPILYSTGYTVRLIDRSGNVMREWHKPAHKIFDIDKTDKGYIRKARLDDEGNLYINYHHGGGIAKFDPDGELIWKQHIPVRNPFELHEDRLYVLTKAKRKISYISEKHKVVDAWIHVLDPENGETITVHSLAKAFRLSPYSPFLYTSVHLMDRKRKDIFHPNSLQVITEDVAQTHSFLSSGDLLLSLRHPSALITLGKDRRVKWLEHGRFWLQHSATIHEDGTLSLFNNLHSDGKSELQVYDPSTKETRLSHVSDELYSACCGRVEKLPNDHYLITATEQGRIVELTSDGEIVWSYYTPSTTKRDGKRYQAAVYQAQHITDRP